MPDVPSRPFIRFEQRAVEDRAATIEKGHYVAKDVDFIIIVPPGDGKTVLEQKVDERHKFRYKKEYEAWKEGREIPIEGTSVKDWTQTSPAIVENLIRANVRTVEQLANCNESTLERIGMGARALQQKAISWLEASAGPGKMSEDMAELSRRMDAQDAANLEKDDLIARLQEENQSLRMTGNGGDSMAQTQPVEDENSGNGEGSHDSSDSPIATVKRRPVRKNRR